MDKHVVFYGDITIKITEHKETRRCSAEFYLESPSGIHVCEGRSKDQVLRKAIKLIEDLSQGTNTSES
jgi:hypothetical protein